MSEGCSSMQHDEAEETAMLASRMTQIKHKIAVLSGKGGVGKSSISVNMAVLLAKRGFKVGLLDADLHGPSVPTLMGIESHRITEGLTPIEKYGVKVISVGFLVAKQEDAVVWRGPMKHGIIRQLLSQAEWGELDFLIIDCPPGTGDEPLSVIQAIDGLAGVVIVTTPQKVAANDVMRSISFCRLLKAPIIGIVENMAGFVCPHCKKETSIFPSGEAKHMGLVMNIPSLGSIPMDPSLSASGDIGEPWPMHCKDSISEKRFEEVVDKVLNSINSK
jgi:ATP-binding protein involved in chromosome partitioning